MAAHHSTATPARKSERALLRIPIRVEGEDAHGNAFVEVTSTLVVNRSGGLIIVSHLLKPGSAIRITNLRNQASSSFQVVMRASRSLTGAPEWGVKSLEPDVEIWGVYFPTRAEEPAQAEVVHVLLECQECASREMAALTVPQYRRLLAQSSLPHPCPKCNATRDWKCGFVEVELDEVLPSLPVAGAPGATHREEAERRRDKRLVVKLPLEVMLPDGSEETSTTENISKSGVCFACNLEMQIGDRVYVSVGAGSPGEELDIPARVVWRRPAAEKGRAFYGVKLEGAG
jgi:hypothetical protein